MKGKYPIVFLCQLMGVSKSGYYRWKGRQGKLNRYEQERLLLTGLLNEQHEKHPSHGYHMLADDVFQETGWVFSHNLAHKCCKEAGIRSEARKYRYKKKEGEEHIKFPMFFLTVIPLCRIIQAKQMWGIAMKILVSVCLLGENCKYNGGNNYCAAVAEYVKDKKVITACPEVMAGMGIPRTPIEIVDSVLMDCNGNNVDAALRNAVAQAMELVRNEKIECAILQSRSPTCGVNQIYDGSFSGKLIHGSGVFAQALREAGYCVVDAEDI